MSIRFPESKFIAAGRVTGSLYDLGEYPGLLLNDANSLVVGEVYEVSNESLDKLDDFEASSDYVRQEVEVDAVADKMKCWIYVPSYGPDFYSNRTLIASGDWMEYAKRNSRQNFRRKDDPRNNTK